MSSPGTSLTVLATEVQMSDSFCKPDKSERH